MKRTRQGLCDRQDTNIYISKMDPETDLITKVLPCEDNPSSTLSGKKVLLSIENDDLKLQSLTRNFHQSDETSLYI